LCTLVSSAEQNDKDIAVQTQIHSVSRPEVEPHLVDAFTYGFTVAKVSEAHTVKSNTDSGTRPNISKPNKPIPERVLSRLG